MVEMAQVPSGDTLWDVKDVSRYLRASRSWIYKAVERGELPVFRIGRLLRFRPDAIRAFVANGTSGGDLP